MITLKKCPFCDGNAGFITNYNSNLHVYFIRVQCNFCKASAQAVSTTRNPETEDGSKAVIDAAYKWNKRTGEVQS